MNYAIHLTHDGILEYLDLVVNFLDKSMDESMVQIIFEYFDCMYTFPSRGERLNRGIELSESVEIRPSRCSMLSYG